VVSVTTTSSGSPGAEWLVLLELASPVAEKPRLAHLLRGPLDWRALLSLADEHGLLALAGARIRNCDEPAVPPEILQELGERQRKHALLTLGMTAELLRLLERFAASGIETLVIKGPALSVRCYGDPSARQYGDLDLIVRGSDIRRSTELMIALGYAPRVPIEAIQTGKTPGEYAFQLPEANLRIEFHTEHTFRYYPRPPRLDELFSRKTPVRLDAHSVPALAPEDELILICIHGSKHFWERLMWIADVAALAACTPHMDWQRVKASARQVGAERMLNLGLRLAMDLLHAPLPQEVAAAVNSDNGAGALAAQIVRRLPAASSALLGLFQRARFRTRLCGGFFLGLFYLLKLSLSPTEEDWMDGVEFKRSALADALRRPIRLARKYGRKSAT